MTFAALILPMGDLEEATVDTVVRMAIAAGMLACGPNRGRFRLAFFHPGQIPAGWSRIGAVNRQSAPCAA